MKIVFITICISVLSACSITPFQGIDIGGGKFKVITSGESKSEAFYMTISAMRSTCGYDGVFYEIVEQTVEGSGKVFRREGNLKEYSHGINNISNEIQMENEIYRGYDIITIFKCTGESAK
jgi:hypothetical protein